MMDNEKYPLCNSLYRGLVEGITETFTPHQFLGLMLHSKPKPNEYIKKLSDVGPEKFDIFTNYIYTRAVDVVSCIHVYLNNCLSASDRDKLLSILRDKRDFYGFMEVILEDMHFLYEMDYSRHTIRDVFHRDLALISGLISLKKVIAQDVNLYWFHPNVFGHTKRYLNCHYVFTMPIIDGLDSIAQQREPRGKFTVLQMTRRHYAEKLTGLNHEIVFGKTITIPETGWESSPYSQKQLLKMIFCD